MKCVFYNGISLSLCLIVHYYMYIYMMWKCFILSVFPLMLFQSTFFYKHILLLFFLFYYTTIVFFTWPSFHHWHLHMSNIYLRAVCHSRAIIGHSQEATCLSPNKGKWFVHQKGQVVCPPKRASGLSPNKGKCFVPPKGQVVCLSIINVYRSSCMYSKGQVVCPSKRASCLSPHKGKLFAPQKG